MHSDQNGSLAPSVICTWWLACLQMINSYSLFAYRTMLLGPHPHCYCTGCLFPTLYLWDFASVKVPRGSASLDRLPGLTTQSYLPQRRITEPLSRRCIGYSLEASSSGFQESSPRHQSEMEPKFQILRRKLVSYLPRNARQRKVGLLCFTLGPEWQLVFEPPAFCLMFKSRVVLLRQYWSSHKEDKARENDVCDLHFSPPPVASIPFSSGSL